MTTVLSPLLLVVLVLVPPLTEAQANPSPCTTNTCPAERPICLSIDGVNRCFCPENTYGDNCENTCGGNLTATTTEGILTSPDFPNRYPTLLLCTWNIRAPAGSTVQLTFSSFGLELSTNCLFDVVRINDVNNFCGTDRPPEILASSFTIFFRSDDIRTSSGFRATFKVVDTEDQCEPNPCLNGGSCRDGDFTCDCAPGFQGRRCEVNIDECQSSPCQNGAICVDGINSFTCDCAGGFSGTLCDEDIDECQSSPCQNGATCVDGVNSFTCDCAAGFSGTLCDVTTYALTYCIARGLGGLVQGAPPAVNLTLRGSAGSTGTVTLTSAPTLASCTQVTLTSTFIGDIQAAMVTPTACGGQGNLLCLQLLSFQVGVSSGAGQRCLFPSTVWYFGLQTRTLAASCEP